MSHFSFHPENEEEKKYKIYKNSTCILCDSPILFYSSQSVSQIYHDDYFVVVVKSNKANVWL